MKNKSVIIVCGDPKSTFNEILIKTLKSRIFKNAKFPIIIIGSKKVFKKELKKLKVKLNLQNFDNPENLSKKNIYNIDIPIDLKNFSLVKKKFVYCKIFQNCFKFA